MRIRILTRMARHRAPDVVPAVHDVHPTGTGRPRHAAGPAKVGPSEDRAARHRGGVSVAERVYAPVRGTPTALEFVPPLVVVEAEPAPVELASVVLIGPAPIEVAPRAPRAEPRDARPYAEVVAWAGFASLVGCGVVGAGQGPREQAIWTLGVLGAVLSTAGLGWLAALRRRGRQADEHPQ